MGPRSCRATQAGAAEGHTHEDIDTRFGVLSGYLGSQLAWDTPHEMAEHAQRYMVPLMPRENVIAGVLQAEFLFRSSGASRARAVYVPCETRTSVVI